MHQQSLSISTTDQRLPPTRTLSAPALLAVLCLLAALPPAAYAITPETAMLVNGSFEWAGPRGAAPRDPKQTRTITRTYVPAASSMMQSSGPSHTGLVKDTRLALSLRVIGVWLLEPTEGPPARAPLFEQLLDLPPPLVG